MDKNISDLSEKTTASSTDYLIIEDASHTYKISKANLSKDKIDEVSISGNTLTFKANGVVVTTITLPSGDGHTHSNKTILDTITESLISTWNNKSDFSGNYNDLTNKPSIPNLDGYATQTYVTNAIANAQLGGGEVDLSGYATKDDLHNHNNKTVLDGITASKVTSWNNKSDFSGNYNDLTNKPSIPTQTSQLTNNSGFLTSIPSEYVTETELAAKGYLTEHQSLSGYATQSYVNTKTNGLTTLNEVKTNLLGGKIHVYLTQAQYDALSNTEKNDSEKVYYITDRNDEIGDLSSLLTTNKTNLVQAINELYQLIGSGGSGGSGGDTTVSVQSVSLNKTTTSLNVGNSVTLTATINPTNATNKTVTWSCNNSNVTLNSNGLTCTVVGATAGTSIITVRTSDGNKTATCNITVNSSSSTVTTSIFNDLSEWNIDNRANATVTTMSGNNLDMVSNGNDARPYTTFTALTVGNKYKITCDYIDPNLKFEFWTADYGTSFEILASSFTNNSYEFTATSALATATISSSTSFPMTLKITNMVFFKSGTSSGGGDTTVSVQGISLNKTTTSLNVGDTVTLNATITPSNATNKNVLWSFDNSNVTLSQNGLTCVVSGAKAGTSKVTVKTLDGNYTATCNITVNEVITETLEEISYPTFDNWNLSSSSTGTLVTKSGKNFEINNATSVKDSPYIQLTTTLTSGNTYVFRADSVGDNCTIELDVDMYMNDPTVLDFSSGQIEFTPTKEYSWIAINASNYGSGVTIKVSNFTIYKKTTGSSSGGDTTIAVQSIGLNSTSYTVEQGSSFPLTAIFNPLDATNKNVTWSASNSNVSLATSTVNCTVTGVTIGTSVVTVTTQDGNKTASCTVTIKASSSSGGGTTGDYSTTLVTPALVSAVDDGNYDIGYFNEGTLGSSGISGSVYYLSPNGSDTSGSGTSSSPWKSINKVRTYVDGLSSKPSKVTILMADGDYNVTTTQIIRGTTFGTSSCPIEIRGIGNKAKITTGTKLTSYTQTTMNGKTCYAYDLSSVSGWNSGNNVFEPTKQDSVPDYDQIKNNKYQCNVTDMPFVSVNGEKLWLASYPNKQDVVFQTGVTGNDGGASGFNNNQTVVIPSGTVRTKLNSFSQLSNISSTNNKVYVQMYWTAKYFAETLLIRGYNSSTGTLTMSAGCLNEDTSPYSSQKFRFYNIKEQLNEESTYWIDYDNNKLYLIPPSGTNMSTAEVVLSHVKNSTTASSNTLIATNSSAQTYVTFERINFCDHRGNVFLGTSSNKLNGVKFFKCRFVNIGRSVFGCNTTYGHYAGTGGTDIVTNCEWRQCRFGNIGEFALFVVGANRNTNSLYSDNNKVYNCVFNKGANTGTYLCNKVHFIYYYGCGMEVKGSKFANHPGQAILWRANDFIINDNIFYQNTWSEADAGTIYSGCDWSFRGVQITNNKFYAGYQADRRIGSDYSGTVGVYLDDLYSAATVSGNYIEGFQKGILIGGGRDNIIQNNTIVDCGQGLIADDRGLTWGIANFNANMIFTNSVPWSSWTSKYPALSTLSSDINNNVKPYGNTIKNNTCRGCYYKIGINSNVSSLGTVSGNTDS